MFCGYLKYYYAVLNKVVKGKYVIGELNINRMDLKNN